VARRGSAAAAENRLVLIERRSIIRIFPGDRDCRSARNAFGASGVGLRDQTRAPAAYGAHSAREVHVYPGKTRAAVEAITCAPAASIRSAPCSGQTPVIVWGGLPSGVVEGNRGRSLPARPLRARLHAQFHFVTALGFHDQASTPLRAARGLFENDAYTSSGSASPKVRASAEGAGSP
jgi:hypothetical protein